MKAERGHRGQLLSTVGFFFERTGWILAALLATNRKWAFFPLVGLGVWVSRKLFYSTWMKWFAFQDEYEQFFPLTTQEDIRQVNTEKRPSMTVSVRSCLLGWGFFSGHLFRPGFHFSKPTIYANVKLAVWLGFYGTLKLATVSFLATSCHGAYN